MAKAADDFRMYGTVLLDELLSSHVKHETPSMLAHPKLAGALSR